MEEKEGEKEKVNANLELICTDKPKIKEENDLSDNKSFLELRGRQDIETVKTVDDEDLKNANNPNNEYERYSSQVDALKSVEHLIEVTKEDDGKNEEVSKSRESDDNQSMQNQIFDEPVNEPKIKNNNEMN